MCIWEKCEYFIGDLQRLLLLDLSFMVANSPFINITLCKAAHLYSSFLPFSKIIEFVFTVLYAAIKLKIFL